MQSVLSKIWTLVAMSISYGDNHYTTFTSIIWTRIAVSISYDDNHHTMAHPWSEVMHIMSVHQLPLYYQLPMVWITSVMLYTLRKLACSKILQKLLTLLCINILNPAHHLLTLLANVCFVLSEVVGVQSITETLFGGRHATQLFCWLVSSNQARLIVSFWSFVLCSQSVWLPQADEHSNWVPQLWSTSCFHTLMGIIDS